MFLKWWLVEGFPRGPSGKEAGAVCSVPRAGAALDVKNVPTAAGVEPPAEAQSQAEADTPLRNTAEHLAEFLRFQEDCVCTQGPQGPGG